MHKSKKRGLLDRIGILLAWSAVILQFILIIQNRQTPIPETIIRFFSFFTILTNILVAFYFTARVFQARSKPLSIFSNSGSVTAITTFILLVGIVYQVILRSIWEPTGLQQIVDELLHTIIPAFMLGYWLLFADGEDQVLKSFKNWAWYPICYFIGILIRGHLSGFYPYPFVNVNQLGYIQVLINSSLIIVFTLLLLGALVFLGRNLNNRKMNHKSV